MVQAKRWCFTLNNYTSTEVDYITSLQGSLTNHVSYLCFGKEVGEQGTPHLQGYVYFDVAKRFNTVSALLPRCHLEVSRGTPAQAIEYCEKDGDFHEFGERPGNQGKRTDIDKLLEWLDEFIAANNRAPSEREFANAQPKGFLRYKNFLTLARHRAPQPSFHDGTTRPWQSDLEEILSEPCTDDRSVLFYVDENGGSGKTWFQKYFFTKHPLRS